MIRPAEFIESHRLRRLQAMAIAGVAAVLVCSGLALKLAAEVLDRRAADSAHQQIVAALAAELKSVKAQSVESTAQGMISGMEMACGDGR